MSFETGALDCDLSMNGGMGMEEQEEDREGPLDCDNRICSVCVYVYGYVYVRMYGYEACLHLGYIPSRFYSIPFSASI